MCSTKKNPVEYGILKCLEEEGSAWKTRVHDWLMDKRHELPELSGVSLQTVGRHVERLRNEGLVESCIMTPDELQKDMIIGYDITEAGIQRLQEHRSGFLQKEVMSAGALLLTGDWKGDVSVDRDVLIALMCDEFDISENVRETVLPYCDTEELVALLAVHYFTGSVGDVIDRRETGKLAEFIQRVPRLRESFMADTVMDRIRTYVAEGRVGANRSLSMWRGADRH